MRTCQCLPVRFLGPIALISKSAVAENDNASDDGHVLRNPQAGVMDIPAIRRL